MTLELSWKLSVRKQVQVQADSAIMRMHNKYAQAKVQCDEGNTHIYAKGFHGGMPLREASPTGPYS